MALNFGTSGVRGLVTEFTDEQVFLLVSAFLKYSDTLTKTKKVAIGMDLRESSPKLLKAAQQAIADMSKTILDCGAIPTPGLAYFAQENQALSVMITGSHIPADRNGIKFYLETGETLKHDDQAIFNLYLKLKDDGYKKELFDNNGNLRTFKDINVKDSIGDCSTLFIKRYLDFFKSVNLKKQKVIFYEHSSVARDIIPQILENLGAHVIRKGRSSTFVPVDTEAVESLAHFQQWIKEHSADALVSTDGDGDRPLIVDNLGRIIQGDKIGFITSKYLSVEGIALPISCNSGISEISEFKEVQFTKIGSPYVVAALDELHKKHAKTAGFEANGGYILKSDINKNSRTLKSLPTRDSILPIVAVLVSASAENITTSDLTERLPKKYTSSVLVKNCPVEMSAKILDKVKNSTQEIFLQISQKNAKVSEVNNLDGIRILSDLGEIIHFRPSGNAPEFRCYTEAATQERAEELASKAKEFITEITKEV